MESTHEPQSDSQDYGIDEERELVEESWHSFLSERPLMEALLPKAWPDSNTQHCHITESEALQGFVDPARLHQPEKWDVDRDALEFLASLQIFSMEPAFDHDTYASVTSLRMLKVEEPALKTSHDMDMMKLRENNFVRMSTDGICACPLEVENDHSLVWPQRYATLPSTVDKAIDGERLDIDLETMEYLRGILDVPQVSLADVVRRDHVSMACMAPASPPVLPLSPPYNPREAESYAEMGLTSTPEDPCLLERKQLEEDMFAQDDFAMEEESNLSGQLDKPGVTATFSPMTSHQQTSSPMLLQARRLPGLKVSSPVLAVDSSEPPTKKLKSMSFDEQVDSMLPQHQSDSGLTDPFDASEDVMAAIAELVQPFAQPAIAQAEQEQLNEFDTTTRVSVPEIDLIVPRVPWEEYSDPVAGAHCLESQRRFLQELRGDIMNSEKKWGGATKLEKLLPWKPFSTHLAKIKPEGEFDDGSCARYLTELDFEGDVSVEALIWKPDKLVLLEDDDYEDDAIEAAGNEQYNTKDLVPTSDQPRKRGSPPARITTLTATRQRAELEDGQTQTVSLSACSGISDLGALLQKRKLQLDQDKLALRSNAKAKTPANGSAPAAPGGTLPTPEPSAKPQLPNVTGLSNFSKLIGWPTTPCQGAGAQRPTTTSTSLQAEQPPEAYASTAAKPAYPLPQLISPDRPFQLIASHTLTSNHRLTAALHQHLPNLDLIERAFPPAHPEADLTLSPTTGLHLTTLQTLKQKPLPGQPPKPSPLTRITTLYPTLLLLIATDIPSLDASDTATLTALPPSAHPFLLPDPTPATHAAWIAACICRHAPAPARPSQPAPAKPLLHEETLGEKVLRAAGMNAFAAQVVLDALRPKYGGGCGGAETGLAAFVCMGREERRRRLGEVLGGEEVLERVGRVVDGAWFERVGM